MRGEAIILITLLLSGCVSDNEPAADARVTPTTIMGETGRSDSSADENADGESVAAPALPLGRAWTYEGVQQYNPDMPLTVVVAQATGSGYLFAGGAEDDLVYDALWGNPFLGARDGNLNRESYWPMLSFPLHDGKTWELREGLMLTAKAADVATPRGSERGFVITGKDDRIEFKAEYAPAAGAIASLRIARLDGTVFDDMRLTKIEEAKPWVWHELGPLVVVGGPDEPAAFDVPEGYDAVLASAGGRDGSRAFLQGPDPALAWNAEFRGEEEWRHAVLPATPGRWAAGAASWPYLEQAPDVDAPIGWSYMHVAPVRWLRSSS